MPKKKEVTEKNINDNKEVEDLKKQIEELKKMFSLFAGTTSNSENNEDRDVMVVSLCSGILNLSTEPHGQGTVYTFNKFGEEQMIPYYDIRMILKSNKRFISEGKCYINDKDIIEKFRLSTVYKNILSKDEIFELFSMDKNKFKSIFTNMTESQKDIFKDLISKKISNNEDIDMNLVQIINEDLNIDLLSEVKISKDLLKEE